MEQNPTSPYRSSAVTALAIVGFISLVGLGVWGGIYSSRYVPTIVNRLGSAAVYLGSSMTPSPTAVPTETATSTEETTISFGTPEAVATTTPARPTLATSTPAPVVKKVAVPSAPVLHGTADLSITLLAKGYLTTDMTDSFVASSSVPHDTHPAVRFVVKNLGTNASGTWGFTAAIPTRTSYTYRSDAQISLLPGESIIYTLGFDRATSGDTEPVTITLDADTDITESSETNNTLNTNLTILP